MTSEQRLDRLERIAKLVVRAGVRYRRDLRELGDKLNVMVDSQIRNDERFKRNEAAFQSRSVEHEKRFARNEERLARLAERTDGRFVELAEFQARTERNLAELIKVMTRGRNGNPETGS
jgi:hypothetical protein